MKKTRVNNFGFRISDFGLTATTAPSRRPVVVFNPKSEIPNPKSRCRGGFTLIEVLATLLLVAIILPVATAGILLSQRTATITQQQTEAAALAQTKLEEIVGDNQFDQAQLAGDFQDHPDFHWTATISDWSTAALKQVDVDVTWMQRGRERNVELSTLVYTGTGQ